MRNNYLPQIEPSTGFLFLLLENYAYINELSNLKGELERQVRNNKSTGYQVGTC